MGISYVQIQTVVLLKKSFIFLGQHFWRTLSRTPQRSLTITSLLFYSLFPFNPWLGQKCRHFCTSLACSPVSFFINGSSLDPLCCQFERPFWQDPQRWGATGSDISKAFAFFTFLSPFEIHQLVCGGVLRVWPGRALEVWKDGHVLFYRLNLMTLQGPFWLIQ